MGKRSAVTGETGGFTRRTVLSGAAAAGAASVLGARPGLAAVVRRRPSVFGAWIGTLSGESAPIRAGRTFALAGIEWTGDAADIELRAHGVGGRWSPWVTASILGHDGDGQPITGPRFGEPVWTGPAVQVQLRTAQRVDGVRVHFVGARSADGGLTLPQGASAAALPQAAPVLEAGPGQPPIIARRAWAGRVAKPTVAPSYGTVKLAFVHHTVNPNGYSAGQVPAMLRAIFDYHVFVRGWWDIGYNFVVDAYGRIWEARAGGIDMAVVGAQAGAYNTESTGVAMLGDFMNTRPSPAALSALEQLLAWKLSLHGLPATGKVTVVVDPSSAFYTRFKPGAHVSLPRIAGHRDGDLTDCPGNALYHTLPSVRTRVAALAGTPAQMTAIPRVVTIPVGSSTELSGTLTLLSGEPLAGAPVELQSLGRYGPPATTFATLATAADGSWSAPLSFQQSTLVRALHRPSPASVSDWVAVLVAPVLTLSLPSTSPLVVSGSVSPAKRHVTVAVYRAGALNRKPVSAKRVPALGGTFSVRLSVPGPGNYVVIARSAADGRNAAGASSPLAVTVS